MNLLTTDEMVILLGKHPEIPVTASDGLSHLVYDNLYPWPISLVMPNHTYMYRVLNSGNLVILDISAYDPNGVIINPITATLESNVSDAVKPIADIGEKIQQYFKPLIALAILILIIQSGILKKVIK